MRHASDNVLHIENYHTLHMWHTNCRSAYWKLLHIAYVARRLPICNMQITTCCICTICGTQEAIQHARSKIQTKTEISKCVHDAYGNERNVAHRRWQWATVTIHEHGSIWRCSETAAVFATPTTSILSWLPTSSPAYTHKPQRWYLVGAVGCVTGHQCVWGREVEGK